MRYLPPKEKKRRARIVLAIKVAAFFVILAVISLLTAGMPIGFQAAVNLLGAIVIAVVTGPDSLFRWPEDDSDIYDPY